MPTPCRSCCPKATAPAELNLRFEYGLAHRQHKRNCQSQTTNLRTRVAAGGEVPAAVPWPVTLWAAKGREVTVTWGQNQGRDFYSDFVQPSQVVRGDADTPDATAGPHPPGPRRLPGQFSLGPDFCHKGQNHLLWQHWEETRISVLSVRNAAGQICGWRSQLSRKTLRTLTPDWFLTFDNCRCMREPLDVQRINE